MYLGSQVSPSARAQIAQTIQSVRFRAEHTGETLNRDAMQVLGLSSQYRVSSFTRVAADQMVCRSGHGGVTCGEELAPLFLVHAPGVLENEDGGPLCSAAAAPCIPADGFYAISASDSQDPAGYENACDLQIDRANDQFYCSNMSARWNRIGEPISRPAGVKAAEPLELTIATVGWNGHVLLIDGNLNERSESPNAPLRYLRATAHLWPQHQT